MCPISFEKAIAKDPSMIGCFSVAGDSMIFVDKRGKRVVNEKLHYNELAQKFFEWDGANAEFPYLILTSIWDQRAQDHSASHEYGRLIVPPGIDDRHVIKGATLEELAANIDSRLQKYAGQNGGMRITAEFITNLKASIARFNEFASAGKDLDFHRGERGVDLLFNGNVKEEPGRKNPTMWPISDKGRTMRRSSPAAHSIPKAGRRPTLRARCWTSRTSRFPGSTGWATAWPPHPGAPIGPVAVRWDPSSGSRIARRIRPTRSRRKGNCARRASGRTTVRPDVPVSRQSWIHCFDSDHWEGMMSKFVTAVRAVMEGAVVAAFVATAMPLFAEDDLAAAKAYTVRYCSQCHTFEQGEKHGQGPNLFGLIGREAAAAPGFVYSEGIKEALKGKVWDLELLDAWLTDTIAVAPKAQMIYFQDDPKVRAKLIRYLQSLK